MKDKMKAAFGKSVNLFNTFFIARGFEVLAYELEDDSQNLIFKDSFTFNQPVSDLKINPNGILVLYGNCVGIIGGGPSLSSMYLMLLSNNMDSLENIDNNLQVSATDKGE